MTPLEQLQENMKNEAMQMYHRGMKDGFNLAIDVIEAAIVAGATVEYALQAASDISKEKFGEL